MTTASVAATVDGNSINVLKMQNAWAAIPFPAAVPSNWKTIRVAVRGWFEQLTENIVGTPRFAVGIQSGGVNGVGAAVCDNFVGYRTYGNTWTYYSDQIKDQVSVGALRWVYRNPSHASWTEYEDALTYSPVFECTNGLVITKPEAMIATISRSLSTGAAHNGRGTYLINRAYPEKVTDSKFLASAEQPRDYAGDAIDAAQYGDWSSFISFNSASSEVTHGTYDHMAVYVGQTFPAFFWSHYYISVVEVF